MSSCIPGDPVFVGRSCQWLNVTLRRRHRRHLDRLLECSLIVESVILLQSRLPVTILRLTVSNLNYPFVGQGLLEGLLILSWVESGETHHLQSSALAYVDGFSELSSRVQMGYSYPQLQVWFRLAEWALSNAPLHVGLVWSDPGGMLMTGVHISHNGSRDDGVFHIGVAIVNLVASNLR